MRVPASGSMDNPLEVGTSRVYAAGLRDLLLASLPSGAVRWGVAVTSYTEKDDGVVVSVERGAPGVSCRCAWASFHAVHVPSQAKTSPATCLLWLTEPQGRSACH